MVSNKFNSKMQFEIKENFLSKTKETKRQISAFFTPSTIEKLDNCIEQLKEKSNTTVNRSLIIEFAVETFVNNCEIAMKDFEINHKVIKPTELEYDTIVCPSNITGLTDFIKNNKWQYVRLNEKKINKIKYIALYVGQPLSKITHYGKVKEIKVAENLSSKKYIILLEDKPIELQNPIELGNTSPIATRSIKYTTLNKLKTAKEYKDLG